MTDERQWPRVAAPGNKHRIESIPTFYAGTWYRSGLEANWAATFDFLNWHHEYEPGGVRIGNINYLPDFRLPGQRVWAEVKGPIEERIDKPRALKRATTLGNLDDQVVVCMPAGPGNTANWRCITGSYHITITKCGACNQWCFCQPDRSSSGLIKLDWRCRHCGATRLIPEVSYLPSTRVRAIEHEFGEYDPNHDWIREWYGTYGRLPFRRAPRPNRTQAASAA